MFLVNAALDAVGAIVKPIAARKRIERATEEFGGDLVQFQIGSQLFVMPKQIHMFLVKTGAMKALRLAAERGDDTTTLRKKEAA